MPDAAAQTRSVEERSRAGAMIGRSRDAANVSNGTLWQIKTSDQMLPQNFSQTIWPADTRPAIAEL